MSARPGPAESRRGADDVEESPLIDAAADHFSLLLWRGIAAVAFALLAFFWPRLTLPGLAILWGCYSLVDGILALTAAITGKPGTPRPWLGAIGMAGLACAGTALVAPEQVAEHLVEIISIWAALTGAMQLWAALKLRKAVDGSWILAVDGIGAILFGVALAAWPRLELAALIWLTGWVVGLLGSFFLCVGLWAGRTSDNRRFPSGPSS